MTIWEWFSTPIGSDLLHALVLIIVSIAAILSALARRIAKDNQHLLDHHFAYHQRSQNPPPPPSHHLPPEA